MVINSCSYEFSFQYYRFHNTILFYIVWIFISSYRIRLRENIRRIWFSQNFSRSWIILYISCWCCLLCIRLHLIQLSGCRYLWNNILWVRCFLFVDEFLSQGSIGKYVKIFSHGMKIIIKKYKFINSNNRRQFVKTATKTGFLRLQ